MAIRELDVLCYCRWLQNTVSYLQHNMNTSFGIAHKTHLSAMPSPLSANMYSAHPPPGWGMFNFIRNAWMVHRLFLGTCLFRIQRSGSEIKVEWRANLINCETFEMAQKVWREQWNMKMIQGVEDFYFILIIIPKDSTEKGQWTKHNTKEQVSRRTTLVFFPCPLESFMWGAVT